KKAKNERRLSSPRKRGPRGVDQKTLGPRSREMRLAMSQPDHTRRGDDGAGREDVARPLKPLSMPPSTVSTRWAQLLALTRFDMRSVFKSPAFFVLLAIGILNAFSAINQTI